MANNAKHPQINLLLTRPTAGSDAFWNALAPATRQLVQPIVSPLVKIVPLFPDINDFGAAIFTSVNGVESCPKGDGRIAYCVGALTTKAALKAGWQAVQKGETAEQLIAELSKSNANTPLTHFAGTNTRGNIAAKLSEAGIKIGYIAVYDQAICLLTDHAIAALSSNFPLLLPLFSPRTAHSFSDQYKGTAPIHIIALSQDVADQVSDLNWETMTVPKRPTRLAMVDAVQMVTSRVTLG